MVFQGSNTKKIIVEWLWFQIRMAFKKAPELPKWRETIIHASEIFVTGLLAYNS